MGDAAGIGPELILKAFSMDGLYKICRPIIIGSLAVMAYYSRLLGVCIPFHCIGEVSQAEYQTGILDLIDLGFVDVAKLKLGMVAPEPGKAAVLYTIEAGMLAMDGIIDAIVSAPLNKESMRAAGYEYEGQTQILGELTGAKKYGMILLLGNMRVMMLTTHTALRKACDAVTKENILVMIKLAHETLQGFGFSKPRIAVAALNPHAGDGGLFGFEEIEASLPAIRMAAAEGIDVAGPFPADTIFLKAKEGLYDLVLAMYHDQANMAAKLLGFGEVVTVLAGLPIVRTSVGHGTAFDIAGKGVADEGNFIEAIKAATAIVNIKTARISNLGGQTFNVDRGEQ